mmetsp:Transcript_29236/g.95282  ORF Transcript_29236/g.95282 Transcript_29236/m.95282 type:complete len:217 (+) Transcript_29236:74-724(+)
MSGASSSAAATFVHSVVETASVGRVEVSTLGSGGPFVALPAMGRVGNPDWRAVASRLAEKSNLRIVLPDPTSNPKSSPSASEFAILRTLTTCFGSITYPCRERWLLDVVPEAPAPFVLAGHSWGGGAACRFAAAFPHAVSRLVLVSPDVEQSVAQQTKDIPTLLIWNKYDPVNPSVWTRRFNGHPNLTIHITDHGFHNILDSHADVIADWLKRNPH